MKKIVFTTGGLVVGRLARGATLIAAAWLLAMGQVAFAQDEVQDNTPGVGHNHEELNNVFNTIRQILPAPGEIIHQPFSDNLDHYGLGAWMVDDEVVAGGKAFRLQNSNARKNVWDAAALKYLAQGIAPRDKVVMVFLARTEELPKDAGTGKLFTQIVVNETPFPTLFKKEFEIGTEWGMYAIAGAANRSFPVGKTQVAFQFGTTEQTIDIGPVFILNLGKDVKLKEVKEALNIDS